MDDEQDLRLAISSGQISPWYQPVVDLESGAVVGAEVLARWLHPRQGVMPAGVFIAVAEDTGLIDSLSELVLGRAFANRASWQHDSVPPGFRVSINISPRQLTRADTPASLAAGLERHGCDPAGVSVEVTETGLIDDLDYAAAQLDAIRSQGITVWLDDFGTGYSSLSLLQRLPLDGVKIDRSFVSNLTTNRRDHSVVAALVGLVQELGSLGDRRGGRDRGPGPGAPTARMPLGAGLLLVAGRALDRPAGDRPIGPPGPGYPYPLGVYSGHERARRTRSRIPRREGGGAGPARAASRVRSGACSGWSRTTRTASTCSPRSRPPPGRCRASAIQLLDEHLGHCVVEGSAADPERAGELVAEATRAVERLVRS